MRNTRLECCAYSKANEKRATTPTIESCVLSPLFFAAGTDDDPGSATPFVPAADGEPDPGEGGGFVLEAVSEQVIFMPPRQVPDPISISANDTSQVVPLKNAALTPDEVQVYLKLLSIMVLSLSSAIHCSIRRELARQISAVMIR